MTFYQEHNNNTHFASRNNELPIILPFVQKEKQRIDFILDDSQGEDIDTYHKKKLPSLIDSHSKKSSNFQFIPYDPSSTNKLQRLPSPFAEDEREPITVPTPPKTTTTTTMTSPPTANEIQYIKRIQALMTLVARQTKEIQSLREFISSQNSNNNDDDSHNNRKRNKQF